MTRKSTIFEKMREFENGEKNQNVGYCTHNSCFLLQNLKTHKLVGPRFASHSKPRATISLLSLFDELADAYLRAKALPYRTHTAQNIERFALCFVLCLFARPYGCTFPSAERQYFDVI